MPVMPTMRPILRAASTANTAAAARTFTTSSPRSMARMMIAGRLGASPEMVTLSNGNSVIKYNIVSSSGPRDNQTSNWFKVTHFGTKNENLSNYMLSLPKGTLAFVEGDVTVRNWEDETGKQRSSVNVVQRNFEVLKRGQPTGSQEGSSNGDEYPGSS